ncbi:MAG: CapA family protein [Myxococcota bacterium]
MPDPRRPSRPRRAGWGQGIGWLAPALLVALRPAPVEPWVTFVGDVSLARGVAAEVARRGAPWIPGESGWVGNLEGARDVGAPCPDPGGVCLRIPPSALDTLAGGPFVALSVANNHALDQGPAGLAATIAGLGERGIVAVPEADGPRFVRVGDRWLGLVAVNLVNRSAHDRTQALETAERQIRLARASTSWVAALPHWGDEYDPAAGLGQQRLADAFVRWGASIVAGAHAHVRQGSACGAGAVWYGLGDHLFDQHPEATFTGDLVRCRATDAALTCVGGWTRRTARSTFPTVVPGAIGPPCAVPLAPPPDTAWWAHPWAKRFEQVEALPSLGPHVFVALHRAWSDLDHAIALRPYVFRIDGDRFVDLWRGTALSRPLVSIAVAQVDGDDVLCAVHRDDTFLAPEPDTDRRRTLAYRWDGFGFGTTASPAAVAACAR